MRVSPDCTVKDAQTSESERALQCLQCLQALVTFYLFYLFEPGLFAYEGGSSLTLQVMLSWLLVFQAR